MTNAKKIQAGIAVSEAGFMVGVLSVIIAPQKAVLASAGRGATLLAGALALRRCDWRKP